MSPPFSPFFSPICLPRSYEEPTQAAQLCGQLHAQHCAQFCTQINTQFRGQHPESPGSRVPSEGVEMCVGGRQMWGLPSWLRQPAVLCALFTTRNVSWTRGRRPRLLGCGEKCFFKVTSSSGSRVSVTAAESRERSVEWEPISNLPSDSGYRVLEDAVEQRDGSPYTLGHTDKRHRKRAKAGFPRHIEQAALKCHRPALLRVPQQRHIPWEKIPAHVCSSKGLGTNLTPGASKAKLRETVGFSRLTLRAPPKTIQESFFPQGSTITMGRSP